MASDPLSPYLEKLLSFPLTQPSSMLQSSTHKYDALVLGGGAAGLMCAIEAGRRGRRVAVLEHAERLGKKILSPAAAGAISPTFIARRTTLFNQSALCKVGVVSLYACGLHRAGREASDSLSRKNLGPAFLRSLGAGHSAICWSWTAGNRSPSVLKVGIQHVTRTDEFVVTAGEKEFRRSCSGGRHRRNINPKDGGDRIWL